jgi:hypothetical protein
MDQDLSTSIFFIHERLNKLERKSAGMKNESITTTLNLLQSRINKLQLLSKGRVFQTIDVDFVEDVDALVRCLKQRNTSSSNYKYFIDDQFESFQAEYHTLTEAEREHLHDVLEHNFHRDRDWGFHDLVMEAFESWYPETSEVDASLKATVKERKK